MPSRIVWQQLVRAAASVSNNLEEADEASSEADFAQKMKITLREAKESRLCLRMGRTCELSGFDRTSALEGEAGELSAIFAAIVINVRERLAQQRAKGKASSGLKR